MLELESGYAKYAGVAAMPASQIIYGFIVMLKLVALERSMENAAAIAVIGITVGVVLLYNAIKQGQVIAAGFKVSKSKPEVFVFSSIIPAGVVEGFALFAFIFALIVAGNI
jgi:V/A-type H+-transporting ATPase subunit K